MADSWHEQLRRAEENARHRHADAAREIGCAVSTLESYVRGRCKRPSREFETAVGRYIYKHTGETVNWETGHEA